MITKKEALREVVAAATQLGLLRILEDNPASLTRCRELARTVALAQIAALDAGATPAEVNAAAEWEGR